MIEYIRIVDHVRKYVNLPIGVIILYVCKIRCLHAPYVVGKTLIVCLGGMNLLQDDYTLHIGQHL